MQASTERFMVFNAAFNNISVISLRNPKKTTDLPQVTDKQHAYNIKIVSNKTSFFRFANKRAIYLVGKTPLAHARCIHLSQVIKSQNKMIYTVVNVLNIYIH